MVAFSKGCDGELRWDYFRVARNSPTAVWWIPERPGAGYSRMSD